MKKTICSILLGILFLSSVTENSTYAAEVKNEISDESVVDMETFEKMEKLLDERAKLVLEWDANEERINEIDLQFLELGGEELSQNELMVKLGATVMPCIDKIEAKNTSWKSGRCYVKYCNQKYELQVIRACPKNTKSPLYHSKIEIVDDVSSEIAFAETLFELNVSNYVGEIPIVGDIYSVVTTVGDVFESMVEGNVTTLDGFCGTNTITVTADEVFVFVKKPGEDDSCQKFCYAGNEVDYLWELKYNTIYTNGYDTKPLVNEYEEQGNISSAFYNDCKAKAVENYYNNEMYGESFERYNLVGEVELSTLTKNKYFTVNYIDIYEALVNPQ